MASIRQQYADQIAAGEIKVVEAALSSKAVAALDKLASDHKLSRRDALDKILLGSLGPKYRHDEAKEPARRATTGDAKDLAAAERERAKAYKVAAEKLASCWKLVQASSAHIHVALRKADALEELGGDGPQCAPMLRKIAQEADERLAKVVELVRPVVADAEQVLGVGKLAVVERSTPLPATPTAPEQPTVAEAAHRIAHSVPTTTMNIMDARKQTSEPFRLAVAMIFHKAARAIVQAGGSMEDVAIYKIIGELDQMGVPMAWSPSNRACWPVDEAQRVMFKTLLSVTFAFNKDRVILTGSGRATASKPSPQ